MPSDKVKRGSDAVIFTLLAIGSVVFINLIASRFFARIDLTEDRIYTLSDASRKLVGALPDRMTAKAFISAELPPHPQIKATERYLRDILDEYAAYSNGKLAWEALNPDTDETVQKEARRLKVTPRNLAVYGQTKSSVAQAYMGVAFQYGGKVETIPFVTRLDDLEYQISSTIRRLTASKKTKVGFTTGHGEPSFMQGLRAVKQQLKDYEVTSVDLSKDKSTIAQDIDILFMVGPSKQIGEPARKQIDRFLVAGKSLAIFVDGMVLETPRGQFGQQAPPRIARKNDLALRKQLEHYGAKLGEDIIMDRQNQRVQLPVGQSQMVITNYPGFPIVTNFDKESPITRKLKALVTVFPASVEPTDAVRADKSTVKAKVLARSSQASWRQSGFFLFDPLRPPQPSKELGPFSLALSLRGQFTSFFNKQAAPAAGGAESRLLVVGDADLVRDQFLGLSGGRNLDLLLNMVDYLAQDEALIAIRAKSQTRRPLRNVEDGTVFVAKLANIVGLPLAFVLFGIGRWRWHRKRRLKRAQEIIGQ